MKSPLILTLSAISLLTACSGGNGFNEDAGGNNGGNLPGPGTGSTVNITAANALLITNVSYQAALASGALAGFSTGTGLLAGEPGGISKIQQSLAVSNGDVGPTANVVIPDTVEVCPGGGTITLSGEIADPVDPLTPTLTAGDYFNVFYQMCNDGFAVIDGSLFYEVDSFTGDLVAGLYRLTMTATFTDMQVTTEEDELVSNGDVTVTLDSRQFPTLDAAVSGNTLTIDGTSSALILTNYASQHSQDTGLEPFPYTQSSAGTIDSTLLSGIVSYTTPLEFEGDGDGYPSVGELLVTGSTSSARLKAIDDVNVRIDIDLDGNGTTDETINTTWVELEGS